MKAPLSLEMVDAEVVVDNIIPMRYAILAAFSLFLFEADARGYGPYVADHFQATVDGKITDFAVTNVLLEHSSPTVIATAGDSSREGDVPMCAIIIVEGEAVQKLFIYDGGNMPPEKITIAAFTKLLEGA